MKSKVAKRISDNTPDETKEKVREYADKLVQELIIVDTTEGHTNKPKPKKGYMIESYYCECGCKKSYYRYVKINKSV